MNGKLHLIDLTTRMRTNTHTHTYIHTTVWPAMSTLTATLMIRGGGNYFNILSLIK